MASSLPWRPLLLSLLSLFLFLLLPTLTYGGGAAGAATALTYHRGPILSGNLKLGLIWYGQFGRVQKNAVRLFIKSLNRNGNMNLEPRVSNWWSVVESYQSAVFRKLKKNPKIKVRVARQVTDTSYSVGKILTNDFLTGLIQKATGGDPKVIAVVFASRQVTVQDACDQCSRHGVLGRQVYMVVGNPETECPGACAWPFVKSDYGPIGVTLQPPSGNIGADAMVMNFAKALAATVTNPYNTGFFSGLPTKPVEAATACPGMFGSGALPGYTGKVRVDPASGGGFNAHGVKGKKFLLPAIWNPKTASCWTIM